jgi:hypothetical protein
VAFGALHQIAGAALFIPTGKYDPTNRRAPGANYYAGSPAYFFTWLPRSTVEASGSLFYLVNGRTATRDTGRATK